MVSAISEYISVIYRSSILYASSVSAAFSVEAFGSNLKTRFFCDTNFMSSSGSRIQRALFASQTRSSHSVSSVISRTFPQMAFLKSSELLRRESERMPGKTSLRLMSSFTSWPTYSSTTSVGLPSTIRTAGKCWPTERYVSLPVSSLMVLPSRSSAGIDEPTTRSISGFGMKKRSPSWFWMRSVANSWLAMMPLKFSCLILRIGTFAIFIINLMFTTLGRKRALF